MWSDIISSSLVVALIDNNSARDVAISGNARNACAGSLLEKLIDVENRTNAFFWFSRVPSPSNISDGPSRGSCQSLIDRNVDRVNVEDLVASILAEVL